MPLDPHAETFPSPDASRRHLLLGGASLLALGLVLNAGRLLPADAPTEELSRDDDVALSGPRTGARAEMKAEMKAERSGHRHAGEEGTMGRPTAKAKSGLYAMPGPAVAAPSGNDQDVWGGLTGTEVGEEFGLGGLGLVGTGRGGGGGTGEGILGLMGTQGGAYLAGDRGYGSGAQRRAHRRAVAEARAAGGTYERPPEGGGETGFIAVANDPMSTFSIDVDTASYSAMRRELQGGRLPHPDGVRIEELVNYFEYDYAAPSGAVPFSVTAEVGECPWNPEHRLVHVGLQGKEIAAQDLPPRNLVFLVDVSGSMSTRDKLPLVKYSLWQLTKTLRAQDRIALVVYAGAAGVVLPPTSGTRQETIRAALERLEAGGGTNGAEGIELAYAQAREAFMEGGVNRVIMASDGDFNVGVSSHEALVKRIEAERKTGIELSVLGYGMGHRDHTMEQLADKGNGNYAYIDSRQEAHKVLVEQAGGTLVTIAKDVKIQVELDPARVLSYRLVGYENRRLAHQDFADDTKDAGEIGAGHSVTALYEVVPRDGADDDAPWMTLGLRYKAPKGEESQLLRMPVVARPRMLAQTSDDFRFSAAVASFGMLLRGSELEGKATFGSTQALALAAMGDDPSCRRHQLVELVGRAGQLAQDPEVSTEGVPCVIGGGTTVEPPVLPEDPTYKELFEPDPYYARRPESADGPAWELAAEPRPLASMTTQEVEALALEVLRLLPPLLALPLFFMALRRPRRRE